MPERFIPLRSGTGMSQILAILNKNFGELDNEGVTKVYRGANGKPSIIEGRLPYDGGFGAIYYDTNEIPRVIVGIAPDGSIGVFISKPGQSVIAAFS